MSTPDFRTPIKSTWRDPIGSLLTNARITKWAKLGWYGEAAKRRALAKTAKQKAQKSGSKSGFVDRCSCGSVENVRYLKFSYLPKPGFYCHVCLCAIRSERDKQAVLDKALEEKIARIRLMEYV